MRKNPVALLIALLAFPIPAFADVWDMPALKKTIVEPSWGETTNGVKEVYYPGEKYQGKATRVFAYYGKPEGKGPFPTMLLVHGGGGKAFPNWVKHWVGRGYCALAMDLAGNGPKGRLPDGGPGQGDDTKFKNFNNGPQTDMWTYQAVAAIVRGHNLLKSFSEVDTNRVGVTGISWGGYLTCIVAGLDDRLKAAVPVYGCGFLQDNSAWKANYFDKMDPATRDKWVKAFDPSQYLPGVKCPIMFLNGTNDFAYPLDSYLKCFNLVKSEKILSVRVRLPHGHIWTFKEVDTFIDSHLKGEKPLVALTSMIVTDSKVFIQFPAPVKVVKGQLHYALAEGPWQKREWKTLPAEIEVGKVSAPLPKQKPLVFFLSVVDERGVETSSPHQVRE
ncbi:MAG: acetylxylan esterase [Gemmataceae bacterium]|nr:acetylxylan esterase [Gemmataceae bacterium]